MRWKASPQARRKSEDKIEFFSRFCDAFHFRLKREREETRLIRQTSATEKESSQIAGVPVCSRRFTQRLAKRAESSRPCRAKGEESGEPALWKESSFLLSYFFEGKVSAEKEKVVQKKKRERTTKGRRELSEHFFTLREKRARACGREKNFPSTSTQSR